MFRKNSGVNQMKTTLIILILCSCPFIILAGKLDDLEKELDAKMDKMEERFMEASRKLDEKFANTLKDDWFGVDFQKGLPFYSKPKPAKIPKAPPIKAKKEDETPVVNLRTIAPVLIMPEEAAAPLPVIEPKKEEYNIKFDFLGEPVTVTLSEKIKHISPVSLDNKSIANFWENVSSFPHKTTLDQVKAYHNNLLKNDWAYLMFLEKMSKQIFPDNRNMQNLYTWFILIKSGYQARIGYDENRIYLLLPATTKVYGKSFFILDGIKFYKLTTRPIKGGSDSIYTYPGKYPGADNKLNLKLKEWPKVNKKIKTRELSFNYSGKKYTILVEYQGEVVDFTKNYPQTDIDAYAGAPLSDSSRKSLLNKIAQLVKGKTETEAVNFLLSFVQNSFPYKTDQQQFGHEKWFFAEETLGYPYSDCEDRSVIFARLTKELLGLKVVLLNYPGHMATAVRFSKRVSGDKVKYKNKVFTVCDPTYIDARYGMAMPQFKGVKPKITEF